MIDFVSFIGKNSYENKSDPYGIPVPTSTSGETWVRVIWDHVSSVGYLRIIYLLTLKDIRKEYLVAQLLPYE